MDAAIKRFAAEHGMKVLKSCAYGELGGFLVSLSSDGGSRNLYINYLAGADTPEENGKRERLQAYLEALKPRVHLLHYRVMSNGVAAGVRLNGKGMADLRMLLPQLLLVLSQEGFVGTVCCSRCGGPANGTEKIVLQGGARAQLLHEACITSLADEQRAAVQQQSRSGSNYWMGLLGAVLGTLVGLIPWILISRLGYFASVFGYLIGLCAKKGYELCRGKLGRPKLFILIACAVLGIVLAEYVDILIQVAELAEHGLGFGELLSFTTALILWEPAVLTEFLVNAGLGLVFALAGLWSVFAQTKEEVDMASGKITVLDR